MMTDDLLIFAEELALRGKGRPKQAALRRAASTAYYALLHALAAGCVDRLAGWSKPAELVTPLYRAVEHAAARRVFNAARNMGKKGGHLARIGTVFIELRDARIEADYDPAATIRNRADTLELIPRSREAIETLRGLPADTRLLLAVQLVTRPR